MPFAVFLAAALHFLTFSPRYVRLGLRAEYEVLVCSHEAPNSFSIQLQVMKSQFSSMMADIAEHVLSDSFTEGAEFNPQTDDPCLVQNSGVWYRGVVLSQEEDKCKVCGLLLESPSRIIVVLLWFHHPFFLAIRKNIGSLKNKCAHILSG